MPEGTLGRWIVCPLATTAEPARAIGTVMRFGTEDSAAFVNGTLDKLATLQGKLAPRANEGAAKKG